MFTKKKIYIAIVVFICMIFVYLYNRNLYHEESNKIKLPINISYFDHVYLGMNKSELLKVKQVYSVDSDTDSDSDLYFETMNSKQYIYYSFEVDFNLLTSVNYQEKFDDFNELIERYKLFLTKFEDKDFIVEYKYSNYTKVLHQNYIGKKCLIDFNFRFEEFKNKKTYELNVFIMRTKDHDKAKIYRLNKQFSISKQVFENKLKEFGYIR